MLDYCTNRVNADIFHHRPSFCFQIKINDESPEPDEFADPGFKSEDTCDLTEDLKETPTGVEKDESEVVVADDDNICGSDVANDEPAELEIAEEVETVAVTPKTVS
jgi:hypothetical protein